MPRGIGSASPTSSSAWFRSLRNTRSGWPVTPRIGCLNFRETFIDNGSVDMLKAMRVDKEVGYDGMLMPDHVPRVDGVDSQQGFAFAFGYIKALIAAVSAEA